MDIQDILANPPIIHTEAGVPFAGGRMDDATLLFLDRQVRQGMRTLETGSGVSTIVFANKGARHTCIAPDAAQVALIQHYCQQHAIPTADLEFVVEASEDALPRLPKQEIYDLALIDGRHGFPNPIVDWYYIARVLKIGGLVVIDDLHIWTCELLVNFLRAEPDWTLIEETERAAVLRKQGNSTLSNEWRKQPYVRNRSRETSGLAKFEYGLGLLIRGNFSLLRDNIAARVRRNS
ncbi:MAG TPA: class I SAM-dependent methyltransferase [Roseiflexaceae bacterium]|nr:class I SAM-dependent methyltransferase [Roseiflexaceae bacterium]